MKAGEGGGQGPGTGVLRVGAAELSHLARTGEQAWQCDAGFRSSRSEPREVLESPGALGEPLLGRRDASPVLPQHVSTAEQASVARLGLRSAGDCSGERSLPNPHPVVATSPRELQAPGCALGRPKEPPKRKSAGEEIPERRH